MGFLWFLSAIEPKNQAAILCSPENPTLSEHTWPWASSGAPVVRILLSRAGSKEIGQLQEGGEKRAQQYLWAGPIFMLARGKYVLGA